MNVTLLQGDFGTYELLPGNAKVRREQRQATGEETVLIQTDWDFPGLARSLGWRGKVGRERCEHSGTDGTIECPDCGRLPCDFIAAAVNWLDRHCGRTFRGKGEEYFG